jgi:hypothetical protein
MRDPALEILDEVYQRSSVHVLEDGQGLEKYAELSERSNKHTQITFIDCSLFLIG